MARALFCFSLLLTACGVEELQAILDKYDTFGSTGTRYRSRETPINVTESSGMSVGSRM